MVTVYDAFKQCQTAVEEVLEGIGFVNGIKILTSNIKSEKEPIFWFLKVINADASDKQQYITYSIEELSPIVYGDGKIMLRKATIEINFYSRKRKIDLYFKQMNDGFLQSLSFSNFELSKFNYDAGTQLFVYSFIVVADVSGSYDE